MIEDGFLTEDVVLRNPVRALKDVSHDPTCKVVLPLKNGKKMTAIEIQRCFHDTAQRYVATHPECHPTYPAIVAEWGSVLDRLASDPMQLYREIDWVMKLHMLTNYMSRRGGGWDDPRIAMMDLQYHDIRLDKGLYYLLERSGAARRMLTEEEIVRAMEEPPEDTRAYFRGQCLKKYKQQIFGVNWDSISLNLGAGPIKRILMEEPTRGTKKRSPVRASNLVYQKGADYDNEAGQNDRTGMGWYYHLRRRRTAAGTADERSAVANNRCGGGQSDRKR
jgi:proteasome accessory factor A